MIDFRYHLVSIVAVFLALSLGLLLGSTALAGPVQRGLNGLSKAEQRQISNLLQQKGQLQGAGDLSPRRAQCLLDPAGN